MGPHHPAMFVPGPGPPPGFPGGPDHWPYGPGPEFGPIPDYQFNNNNDPIKKRRGRKKRKVDEFAAMNGYMEVSQMEDIIGNIVLTLVCPSSGISAWDGGSRCGPGQDQESQNFLQTSPVEDNEGSLPS